MGSRSPSKLEGVPEGRGRVFWNSKFKIDKTLFCLKCSRSAESASSLCARLLAFAKIQNCHVARRSRKGKKEQKGQEGTLRTLMSLRALRALRPLKKTLDAKKTQSAVQMQGRQNDAFPIWLWCYRAFESSKKCKVRREFCAKRESGPAVCSRK